MVQQQEKTNTSIGQVKLDYGYEIVLKTANKYTSGHAYKGTVGCFATKFSDRH